MLSLCSGNFGREQPVYRFCYLPGQLPKSLGTLFSWHSPFFILSQHDLFQIKIWLCHSLLKTCEWVAFIPGVEVPILNVTSSVCCVLPCFNRQKQSNAFWVVTSSIIDVYGLADTTQCSTTKTFVWAEQPRVVGPIISLKRGRWWEYLVQTSQ